MLPGCVSVKSWKMWAPSSVNTGQIPGCRLALTASWAILCHPEVGGRCHPSRSWHQSILMSLQKQMKLNTQAICVAMDRWIQRATVKNNSWAYSFLDSTVTKFSLKCLYFSTVKILVNQLGVQAAESIESCNENSANFFYLKLYTNCLFSLLFCAQIAISCHALVQTNEHTTQNASMSVK